MSLLEAIIVLCGAAALAVLLVGEIRLEQRGERARQDTLQRAKQSGRGL